MISFSITNATNPDHLTKVFTSYDLKYINHTYMNYKNKEQY